MAFNTKGLVLSLLGPVLLPPGLTHELKSCRLTIAGAKDVSKRVAALA